MEGYWSSLKDIRNDFQRSQILNKQVLKDDSMTAKSHKLSPYFPILGKLQKNWRKWKCLLCWLCMHGGGPVVIRPWSKMVMRKRKADEVVNLSADGPIKWIKTELWEERVKLVEEVVKVEEREEEEEMEEGPITNMPPEILNVIFSILPHKWVIWKASEKKKTNNFVSPPGIFAQQWQSALYGTLLGAGHTCGRSTGGLEKWVLTIWEHIWEFDSAGDSHLWKMQTNCKIRAWNIEEEIFVDIRQIYSNLANLEAISYPTRVYPWEFMRICVYWWN